MVLNLISYSGHLFTLPGPAFAFCNWGGTARALYPLFYSVVEHLSLLSLFFLVLHLLLSNPCYRKYILQELPQQWIIFKDVYRQKSEHSFQSPTQANVYYTLYLHYTYDAFSSFQEPFPILSKAVKSDILDKTDHKYDPKWQSLEDHTFPENATKDYISNGLHNVIFFLRYEVLFCSWNLAAFPQLQCITYSCLMPYSLTHSLLILLTSLYFFSLAILGPYSLKDQWVNQCSYK